MQRLRALLFIVLFSPSIGFGLHVFPTEHLYGPGTYSSVRSILKRNDKMYVLLQVLSSKNTDFGAWMVQTSLNNGKSWKVVDQFQVGESQKSFGAGFSASGRMFVTGWAKINGKIHGIIRRSDTKGRNWKTVLLYRNDGEEVWMGSLAFDSRSIFAVGNTSLHWITLQSKDDGATWNRIDNDLKGKRTSSWSIETNRHGDLYTTGWYVDEKDIRHWRVKLSRNGGVSWSDIDDFQDPVGTFSAPEKTAIDSQSRLYLAGMGDMSSEIYGFGKIGVIKRYDLNGQSEIFDRMVASDYKADLIQYIRPIIVPERSMHCGFGNLVSKIRRGFFRCSRDDGRTWKSAFFEGPHKTGSNIYSVRAEGRGFWFGGSFRDPSGTKMVGYIDFQKY